MKRLFLISIVIFSLNCAFAQSTFERIIKSPNADEYLTAASVIQTSDHGFVIAGYDSLNYTNKIFLVKTDSLGYVSWSKNYKCYGYDRGTSVEQTTDGGFIIGGNRDSTTHQRTYIIKTNSFGDTLWTKVFDNTVKDLSYAVRQTADGGYAVAGTIAYISFYPSAHLTKLDASGNLEFSYRYGEFSGTNWYVPIDFKQLPDKGYIMAGWTTYGAGSFDMLVLRTDSAGTLLWNKVIGGSQYDIANSVIPSSDGGFILAGTTRSYGAGNADVYLIKLDAGGTVSWIHTYGGANNDEGKSVIQTGDGGYMITGYTESLGPNAWGNVLLIKTDALGNLLWSKSFGTGLYETGQGIVKCSDGGYLLAGTKGDTAVVHGFPEIYLLKLDSAANADCLQSNGTLTQGQAIGTLVNVASLTTNSSLTITNPAWTVGTGGVDSMICQSITGVKEFNTALFANIYPNPAHNFFTISLPAQISNFQFQLSIYDVTGREVYSQQLHSSLSTINSQLSTGLYFVQVKAGDRVWTEKVVIE